jgi:hypothetical protein
VGPWVEVQAVRGAEAVVLAGGWAAEAEPGGGFEAETVGEEGFGREEVALRASGLTRAHV